MIVIGIDPGISGALAIVDHRHTCVVHDLPTQNLQHGGRNKRKLDARALHRLLRDEIHLLCPADEVLALIEDVHVMPTGKAANTSLMHSKGVIEGVLGATRYRVAFVPAQTWKRHHGLTADKCASLERARGLYPTVGSLLRRAKDHNRAEALLIARYGLEELT